jgi:hypothetical protein
MAFINFDCPECGHNLEVDERGAGFIVKCPECQEPIQIPGLPSEETPSPLRRHARTIAEAALLVVLAALAGWLFKRGHDAASRAGRAETEAASLQQQLDETTALMQARLAARDMQHRDKARDGIAVLDDLVRRLADQSGRYLKDLDSAETRLLENSKHDQEKIVRAAMKERLEDARLALPQPPVEQDAEAGRGLLNRGTTLTFPVLLGADGQPLRENAEVTGIDGDQVSVRFSGGSATYRLKDLHPGVVAWLPAVDPLLLVPPPQRKAEALRLHRQRAAARAEELAAIEHEIDVALHSEP